MAGTNALLDGIVADLWTKFPELKACEVRDGLFEHGELARIATRTPAMFVACLGMRETRNPGTEQADAGTQLAVYVATRSTPQLPRGVAARNLVDALLAYVPAARWGLTGVGEVSGIAAENLYSAELDATGIALWSVTWTQVNRLGTGIFDVAGVMPTELYIGVSPNTGPDHLADYEQGV